MKKSWTILVLLLGLLATNSSAFELGGGSAQPGQPSVRDLDSLLASPIARVLSGAGERALHLMTGRIPRGARARLPELASPAIVVGPEIRVNNPVGDPGNQATQSETSIAVTGQNVVIGWNDSAVCCIAGATRFSGFGVSHDGGATFTDQGVIPAPSGVDLFGDPSVVADSAGNFYYASLAARGSLSGLAVSKSTDGGTTFPIIRRADIDPTRSLFQDKEYLAADTSPTSPFQGNLYIAWGSFGIFDVDIDFARSTDGGLTWFSAIAISGASGGRNGAVPAVDRAGRVYVAWEDFRSGLLTGQAIFINRSDNGGATFSGERKVADVVAIGSQENCGGQLLPTLNGSIRVTEFPTIAVDKSSGPNDGNVYIAWNDNRNGDPDILFSRSTDGGLTWSDPIRVNNDATSTDQFMPWMTVDPSGVIYIIWYDRRLDPVDNRLIDVFVARSTDGGVTFGNGRVTTVAFDVPPLNPNFDPVFSDCYMGDYNGITADSTTIYGAWGDNRDEVGIRPDPNVFFRKAVVR